MTPFRTPPRLSLSLLVLVAGFAPACAALAGEPTTASPWSPGVNSQARLLAAGGPEPGTAVIYRAGIEIELKRGAHTYWRQPGDAGVPPQVSFEGSQNLKSAELRYPAPARIDESGLQVFGYRQSVILPIDVRPQNPAAPVHLAVKFDYAACERVCVPAEANATLDLAPRDARGPDAGRLLLASVSLPERAANGGALTVSAKPLPDQARPSWRITIDQPRGPWRDLFVEPPQGWYMETKRVGDAFELVAVEAPKGASAPADVTLTLTGPRDYEVKVNLPAPPKP